jgi:signal transduction histidine kinase
MTPLREWLKPPRTLLLILFLLTLISVSALGWFGWKVLDQERLVEAQRLQERLEQTADRIAATLRGTLAEAGERLGASIATPPAGGLLLRVTEKGLSVQPDHGLLYYPDASDEAEAQPAVFAEGEAFEFQQNQPEQALLLYRRLTNSPGAAVRAGAWLRVGRILRKMGRIGESLAAYRQLAAIGGVKVAGAPAELVGRQALAELNGDSSAAEALRRDLLRGRWRLTHGQFDFYFGEASRLAGHAEPPDRHALALAEAAVLVWEESRQDHGSRRSETVWVQGEPVFLLWRAGSVLVTKPEFWLKPLFASDAVSCAAVDGEGRLLAGRRSGGHAAVRTAAESQLPWTIYVTGTLREARAGGLARQHFLLLGIAVMVVFLILGTYFIARAVRREIEVARMQSDFVAAVSHEFRSPLTSMRQLSEILAFGRIPSEERRQVYYETLVRETSRLQRLVEALLNFGKMEAGARLYRFEELDAGALVHRVVAEFAPYVAGQGRYIELAGPESGCPIEADPEALSVALRNLVDNAIKYSPDHPTVWVEWSKQDRYVAIRVRDRGPGIAETERKAIFRKFVRGSAAAAANVKGSGVGLAMVRHIVAAHGGEITVASEPGQGSTFTMLLPGVGNA